jgi:hypothetical protein
MAAAARASPFAPSSVRSGSGNGSGGTHTVAAAAASGGPGAGDGNGPMSASTMLTSAGVARGLRLPAADPRHNRVTVHLDVSVSNARLDALGLYLELAPRTVPVHTPPRASPLRSAATRVPALGLAAIVGADSPRRRVHPLSKSSGRYSNAAADPVAETTQAQASSNALLATSLPSSPSSSSRSTVASPSALVALFGDGHSSHPVCFRLRALKDLARIAIGRAAAVPPMLSRLASLGRIDDLESPYAARRLEEMRLAGITGVPTMEMATRLLLMVVREGFCDDGNVAAEPPAGAEADAAAAETTIPERRWPFSKTEWSVLTDGLVRLLSAREFEIVYTTTDRTLPKGVLSAISVTDADPKSRLRQAVRPIS